VGRSELTSDNGGTVVARFGELETEADLLRSISN
jgi:hypothetical protein